MEKLIEVLKKELLTRDEFDYVQCHEQVEEVENCGSSGRYPTRTWYNVRLTDGSEYSVYLK